MAAELCAEATTTSIKRVATRGPPIVRRRLDHQTIFGTLPRKKRLRKQLRKNSSFCLVLCEQIGGTAPTRLVLEVEVVLAPAPVLSFTMKLSSCSSIDQGGGEAARGCSECPAFDTFQKQHHPQPDSCTLDIAAGASC